MAQRYVAYYRVSTKGQGESGLGLEAQRAKVQAHLNGGDWSIVGEFEETETGTAKRFRPKLQEALALCRIMNAQLIVAKVDRLTRDPDFMTRLTEAGVDVVFCNLPRERGSIGTFMLRQMLAVGELEAAMISERTKEALTAAKARGVKLGGDRGSLTPAVRERGRTAGIAKRQAKAGRRASDLEPILADIRASGASSLREIAAALNDRGIRAARGGEWSANAVKRVVDQFN
ncbi:recombinase family protein [Fulvimarina sp. MAC3]|uniref:recombinase family protein n=1 Tax=Fulvimarina sp. MAC3 TaxID=3148887 RepID=UPI0031FC75CD